MYLAFSASYVEVIPKESHWPMPCPRIDRLSVFTVLAHIEAVGVRLSAEERIFIPMHRLTGESQGTEHLKTAV